MERLLGGDSQAWEGLRIGQRIDDLLHLDEGRGPSVAEEQWDGILMGRPLVHKVDAEGLRDGRVRE